MVRRERVQIGASRKAALGKLRRHPTTGDHDPTAARLALCRGADLIQGVGEGAHRFPVDLGIPTQASECRVNPSIDQFRDHGPPRQIDDPRRRSDQRPYLALGADREETSVFDRNRLADREIAVDGNNFAAAQHQVGRRLDRERAGKVNFVPAAGNDET